MNPVALLTPTYGRDLELCTLLCESVDRHVKSFSKHYLLVPDCDLPLFAHFESEHRVVHSGVTIPAGMAAAAAAHRPAQAPPVLVVVARQAGERLACPAVPQDRRGDVAAPSALLHPRFRHRVLPGFRPVALRASEPDSASEHAGRGDRRTKPHHARWVVTSHQLLGLPVPPLPASDFIGHIIFWDQQTTRAMAAKIEAVTGLRLDRSAVQDPRVFRIHAVRLFRARTTPASPPAYAHTSSTPVRQLLGRHRSSSKRRTERSCFAAPARMTSPFRSRPSPARRWRPSAPRSPRISPRSSVDLPRRRRCGARRAMLIGQASINLSANVLSALLGLLSVFIFTRLFSPHDYGVYLLGIGVRVRRQRLPGRLVPQPHHERARAGRRHRRSRPRR